MKSRTVSLLLFAGLHAWFVIIVQCLTPSTLLQFIVVVANMLHVSTRFLYFAFVSHETVRFSEGEY